MESKPVETENKNEGEEHQLSPTTKLQQQQEWLNSKKNSPLVFLKKRVKSGGKKRRDSGQHSDGDYEPVGTIDEERSVDAVVVESTAHASRRLSLDSASSQTGQQQQQQQQTVNKEKPRRGIAKVFHDLKQRSRVRKSHSAPPAAMDNQVSSPVSTAVDDDSFSSYATPMEAHSSGYSTPLFESNLASPRTSLSESFVEEDEEQDQADETTTLEASHSPAQVASVLQSNNPPSKSASSPASSARIETLSIPKASSSVEIEPVDAEESLASSDNTKSDCRRPETDEEQQQEEATPVATPATSSTSSTPTEDTTLTTIAGQRSRIPLLSQHRASVPCTSTVGQPTGETLKGLQQQADRSSSVSEVRFCFSEYVNGDSGTSPGKGFIRSLPSSDSKMDPATAGNDANGYPKNEHLYKVLVIGELGTGKTSIIKRYVHQFFSQHYRATIGVDFALKVVHWDQSTVIRLQLWDIAGQERFGNMTRVYYKEAVGAFIVFDVTRGSTFESVAKWKQDLDTKVQLPDGSPIPCVLLANKCDQPKEGIAASSAKLDEYCKEKGFAGWFETSAKDNINIDDAAKFLVGTILQNDQWSNSVKEDDADKLELNGKGGTAGGDKKKSGCC